ncbi:MAG TPA: S41 family peptidase [Steroidobacteraceae bacterium]|nr:S41 family peptidase [Steroidobacteraceae bacterium]
MQFQHGLARIAIWISALLVLCSPVRAAGPTFTADQLRADLVGIERALGDMPPDISYTANVADLERRIRELHAELSHSAPMDRDAVWRMFSTLNPVLADGHLFVGFVDWRGDTRTHLSAGGGLFPFEVEVTADCELSVRAELGGRISPLTDARVRTVNGIASRDLCQEMMARAHGETREFRAALLSRRFWFFYWKLHGAPDRFELALDNARAQTHPASNQLPEILAHERNFEHQFKLQFIANESAAILTMGTFDWPDIKQITEFTQAAFKEIHERKTTTLIIDLRDNGGGSDEVWIDGLMPYVATKPYRTASTYRKRVVVANPQRFEVVGSIVDGEIETWRQPQPGNPHRFTGKVFVAVGPYTYSSAVVFCNVMKDFGFGTIAGTGNSVRAGQTGGVRRTTLANSGLTVNAPRFVLSRPSGVKDPTLLTPDLYFDHKRALSGLVGAETIDEIVTMSR